MSLSTNTQSHYFNFALPNTVHYIDQLVQTRKQL
jgi:hypothetical protein